MKPLLRRQRERRCAAFPHIVCFCLLFIVAPLLFAAHLPRLFAFSSVSFFSTHTVLCLVCEVCATAGGGVKRGAQELDGTLRGRARVLIKMGRKREGVLHVNGTGQGEGRATEREREGIKRGG